MLKNKSTLKRIIFIIWIFVISFVVIGFLTILLLALQSKPINNSQIKETSTLQSTSQEQQTYNNILNKIDKEINELTKPTNRIPILDNIEEFDPQTGKKIKQTNFNPDGTIKETIIY